MVTVLLPPANPPISITAKGGGWIPGEDIAQALTKAIGRAAPGEEVVVPPGDWTLSSNVTITGKSRLRLTMQGRVTHTAAALTFDGCDHLTLVGNIIGNSIPAATVVSANAGTKAVTLSDAALFSVGDDLIFTLLSDDGTFPVFAYRGVISAKAGNVVTMVDNTGIGGAFANLAAGMVAKVGISSDPSKVGFVNVSNCTDAVISGYFERDLALTNVTHSKVDVRTRYGYLAASYCYNLSASVVAHDSRFYGAAFFKCRKLAAGSLNVDRALFGGAVFKNCYDSGYALLNVRQGIVYGVQIRDDIGTIPSTVNPDLQGTVADLHRFTCGTTTLLECGRGFFPDNAAQEIACGPMTISRTAGCGASVHVSTSGVARVRMPNVLITDHGQSAAMMGSFRSGADIRIEEGIGIEIDAVVRGSKHPAYVFTANAGAGLVRGGRVRLTVENCLAPVDISGNATDLDLDLHVKDPATDGQLCAVQITGSVDNIRTRQIKVTSANGNRFQCGVRVTGGSGIYPGRVYLNGVDVEAGSVSFADLYTECGDAGGEGGEIYCPSPTLRGGGTHAVSARYTAKIFVTDADFVGDFHKLNFTSTSYTLEGRKQYVKSTYDPASIAAGGVGTVDVTVPQVNLASIIEAGWSGSNLSGLILSAYRKNSTTITAVFYNPTGSAVDVAAGLLTMSWREAA